MCGNAGNLKLITGRMDSKRRPSHPTAELKEETMHVLILEDDVALGQFLAKGMTLEKHKVDVESNGRAGLESLLLHPPDLLVLDLGLPGMDGLEILERMQGRCPGTSVLVLTGRNGVESRVQCLNLGADDCLPKPFSFTELTARCRALLRRREKPSSASLRVGEIEIDRMQRTVRRNGRPIDLTSKEFSLLEYLVLARGRTCLRSELLREVWQAAPPSGTNVVDVYINYLRKKLGQGAEKTGLEFDSTDRVIETVRGEGYAISLQQGRPDAFAPPLLAFPGNCAAALANPSRTEAIARA